MSGHACIVSGHPYVMSGHPHVVSGHLYVMSAPPLHHVCATPTSRVLPSFLSFFVCFKVWPFFLTSCECLLQVRLAIPTVHRNVHVTPLEILSKFMVPVSILISCPSLPAGRLSLHTGFIDSSPTADCLASALICWNVKAFSSQMYNLLNVT